MFSGCRARARTRLNREARVGAPAPSRRRGAHSRPSSRRWRRARATPGRAGPGPGSSEWKTTWPQTIDKGARAGRPSAAHARKQRGQSRARPRPPWDPRRRGPGAERIGEPGAPSAPAAGRGRPNSARGGRPAIGAGSTGRARRVAGKPPQLAAERGGGGRGSRDAPVPGGAVELCVLGLTEMQAA